MLVSVFSQVPSVANVARHMIAFWVNRVHTRQSFYDNMTGQSMFRLKSNIHIFCHVCPFTFQFVLISNESLRGCLFQV